MKTVEKIEQALNLKQEVEHCVELLRSLCNSDLDCASQQDRVRINEVRLEQHDGLIIAGAARFKRDGELKALGIRKVENGTVGSVEITVRTLRSKTSIIKKTMDPHRRNYATVATAWFRADGGVIRYQEESRRMKTSA